MRNRILEVAAAIAIGLTIGLAIFAAWRTSTDESSPATTTSTLATTGPLDPTELVVAYGRSREATHVLTGEIVRVSEDRETRLAVRRARDGSRALDEVGQVALVTRDGETRQCEVLQEQLLCSEAVPQPSVSHEVQLFAEPLLRAEPSHDVYDFTTSPPPELTSVTAFGDVECWTVLARERNGIGPVGDESTLCFETTSGVLVGSVKLTGRRTETFRASMLDPDVEPGDLEPTGS